MDQITTQYYSKDVNTTFFTLDLKDSQCKRRCCMAKNHGNCKWYGLKDPFVHPRYLTFCEYCYEKYLDKSRFFEVTNEEYPEFEGRYNCDSSQTDNILQYNLHRCLNYNGLRLNVNRCNALNEQFAPTMALHTEQSIQAMKKGVFICNMGSHSYWEFVLSADPNGKYAEQYNKYFKIEKAVFGDGREVKVTNSSGNTEFFTKISKHNRQTLVVNSYNSGKSERFFFVSPCKKEKDFGLDTSHVNKSNILKLTISIHERIDNEPTPVFRSTTRGFDGGPTRGLGGGATRGLGGVFAKGCNDAHTGAFGGGSNLSAEGNSSYVKTHTVDAEFPKIDEVNITVQLICNDSDEEKEYNINLINEKIKENKFRELQSLKRKRNEIDEQIENLKRKKSEIDRQIENFDDYNRHQIINDNCTHEEQDEFLMVF